MDPVTFTGGARIGESYWRSINYSWPLATLTIRQDEVILKMPLKSISFQRSQVVAICAYRGIISDGIQIQHSSKESKEIPSFMVFWTQTDKVLGEFKLFHYPCVDTTTDEHAFKKFMPSAGVSICLLFIIFLLLLAHEYMMKRGTPDALLNATALTLFLSIIYFVMRSRILR